MPNAALSRCTLPAERARGVVFAQDFRDRLFLARDGWTLYNSPTFRMPRKGGGIELNGTNQYLTCPLNGELNNAELTIEIEFWPDFDYTYNGYKYLFDSTQRTYVRKQDNVGGNVLEVKINGITVASLAAATYGPYWKTNKRNLLTISATSGSNDVYFNGQAVSSTATVTSPVNSALFILGSAISLGVLPWSGVISRFAIGHYLASQQEHIDAWNQTTWNWPNKLAYDLSFSTGRYDPTNKRTLDTRTDSLYATLGDGAGTGEPTQGQGFMTFDGVNDYLSGIANPTGSFTVMGLKDEGTGWEFFADNDLTNWTPIFTSGGFTGKLAHLSVASSVLTPVQELDAERKYLGLLGMEN